MTAHTSSSEGIGVPDGLVRPDDRELEFDATTYVHETSEYCERDTDGRVIVGITNDSGEALLLVDADHPHAILPNCHVEDGEWATVARRTVEESTGIAVDLGGPELVRAVDHQIEGEDEPRERTHHVVFGGSPAGDASAPEPTCPDPHWSAGWYAEIPVDLDDDTGDVLADIERFLG